MINVYKSFFVLFSLVVSLLFVSNIVNSYYLGFEYGMNKSNAYKALSIIENDYPGIFDELEQISFTSLTCTGHWGGYCNLASYEFIGNHNRIKIGDYNNLCFYQVHYLLLHEIIHHQQVISGRVVNAFNGFPGWAEQEADQGIIFRRNDG